MTSVSWATPTVGTGFNNFDRVRKSESKRRSVQEGNAVSHHKVIDTSPEFTHCGIL